MSSRALAGRYCGRVLATYFRWSASVAAFGMMLRDSEYVKNYSYDEIVQMAQAAKGNDHEGYRSEFINMVKSFGLVASK